MSKYYLFQDTKKCIGCHSCEVACKSNKRLPVGPKLCQIITIGPKFGGRTCPGRPIPLCPVFIVKTPGAWLPAQPGPCKRGPTDGIVFVEESLCVGCKTCMSACPWGAPQWNPETGKVVKCDYCKDRVDAGLKPACATICTTHCLHFGKARGSASGEARTLRPRHGPLWNSGVRLRCAP